jgi:hypothetical protein
MLYGAASGFEMALQAPMAPANKFDISEDLLLQHLGGAIDVLHRHLWRRHGTREMLARLSNPEINYEEGFQVARSNWCPKRRWVDGAPVNTLAARIIARAFPEAQFILPVRDPSQVVASFQRSAKKGGADFSARDSAVWWLRATEAGMKGRAEFGDDRVLLLFYEKFSDDPTGLMRDCFRFLNEPNFDPSARTFMTMISEASVQKEGEDESRSDWIDDPAVKHCVDVYDQLKRQVPVNQISWGEFATGDLAAWERDLRTRLINCFRGA